jgi:5-methylcytosine-specific restriction endonuclease McrA
MPYKRKPKNKQELSPKSGTGRKPVRKKATKRVLVPKTRNSGTMTESAFWSFIRSALRQKSRWWKPITETKMAARRAYKGPNKKQRFEYQCAVCMNYFPDKKVNVDHIIPAGTLKCANDLPGFVERLFCEAGNLQVLCSACHDVKTKNDKDGKQ